MEYSTNLSTKLDSEILYIINLYIQLYIINLYIHKNVYIYILLVFIVHTLYVVF